MYERSEMICVSVLLTVTMLAGGCSKTQIAASALPAASAASSDVSDVDVTEHVKTALLQNNALKGTDINVVTTKGDVRLIGVLDNQSQIDEAVKTARAAQGAHSIHDELTAKK